MLCSILSWEHTPESGVKIHKALSSIPEPQKKKEKKQMKKNLNADLDFSPQFVT